MNRPDYSPTLVDRETGVRGGRYTLYAERFEELVRQTLAELYDPRCPSASARTPTPATSAIST